MAYRRDLRRVLTRGTLKEQKQVIRVRVEEMTLDSTKLNVETKYRVLEGMFMNERLAGADCETIHVKVVLIFVYHSHLLTQGRRPVLLQAA